MILGFGNGAPMKPGEKKLFRDAAAAFAYVKQIYDSNTAYLRDCFARLAQGKSLPDKVSACYPYAAITTEQPTHVDTRLSYGFVRAPGRYSTTLTRPDIFERYYIEQFEHLLRNHSVPIEIGVSSCPIPIHFAVHSGLHVEGGLTPEQVERLRRTFPLPDLSVMDDKIANGTWQVRTGEDRPLALFTAPRVDYSISRLRHYTGTDASHFQKFVIFTNYSFYVDEFIRLGMEIMSLAEDRETREYRSGYMDLTGPAGIMAVNANLGSDRKPQVNYPGRAAQMPAYHLRRPDGNGITLVNIGVGPSNARNISDHIAVLRPNAWIMLGHCAGLRETQRLGDYVLAHGYVRDDHVLDEDLPLWVPVPALAEVQKALESTVEKITGRAGYDLKSVMRTGTVITTANRNWEIDGYEKLVARFNQSRAIALDMESAVIAANGYRFRVPYGTLLCVSDRPLHGELKLAGMADSFYKKMVDQHLLIGVKAMEMLRDHEPAALHSRKLRSFAETAFQ